MKTENHLAREHRLLYVRPIAMSDADLRWLIERHLPLFAHRRLGELVTELLGRP